jgi:hypothetical protein
LILAFALTSLWEWRMRALELAPGDLGVSESGWANERRRIDSEPVQIAIVGDSRILFDTDLERFEKLTGVRPVQLALPGTNARPFLEDLADDPNFKGIVIVGIADLSYFRERVGLMEAALKRGHWESPANRGSFLVDLVLEHRLAFLDADYRLSALVARLDPNLRQGVEGPYNDVWKIAYTGEARQTWLWPRIERDARLRAHARAAWDGFKGKPVPKDIIAMTLSRTSAAVARIRARGGDVVFVHPPSAPQLRMNEDKRLPRSKGWDILLATARVEGVHADDLPQAQGLIIPEWSHLTRACATVFTDAYVRKIGQLVPQIAIKADAPSPLSARNCI